MQTMIMWMMATGALAGGLDHLCGNRLGLGKHFERAFQLWGSTALSMIGIICLTPLLSKGLEATVVPLWQMLGLDPGMLGGVLAIDMGGWQLAQSMAQIPGVAPYAGLMIAATLGCTITFTIPVGMGLLSADDRASFAKGLLIGLAALSPVLTLGALLCGLPLTVCLYQNLPVYLLTLLLVWGLTRFQDAMVRFFSVFAKLIQAVATIGLTLAAVGYMTGVTVLPELVPIGEAAATVSSIVIVMSGSLPIAELIQRLLRKPLTRLAQRTGLNASSLVGLIIGAVSVMPAIALLPEMDERGKRINAACMVCSASALAAHLGFTFAAMPDMVVPLLVVKLAGGAACAVIAYAATGKKK